MRAPARELVGDGVRAGGKIGLADRLDREQERREIVTRIGCAERTDDGIDIGADVQVLRHHGDVGRRGGDGHALFGRPIPQTR